MITVNLQLPLCPHFTIILSEDKGGKSGNGHKAEHNSLEDQYQAKQDLYVHTAILPHKEDEFTPCGRQQKAPL